MLGKVALIVLLASPLVLAEGREGILGDAAILPGHQIWTLPGFQSLERDVLPKELLPLEWSFALERRTYRVGDTITGRLRVRNPNKQLGYLLSPPYRGVFVDTIGVWISAQDPTTRTWKKAYPLFRVNKGELPGSWPWSYPGRPLQIKAGTEYSVWIPVNAFQQAEFSPHADCLGMQWVPAAGPCNPGQYRLYLQYVDLDRYGCGSPVSDPAGKRFDIPPTVKLRRAAPIVILGPFEFSVHPPQNETGATMLQLCRQWEGCFKDGRYEPLDLPSGASVSAIAEKLSSDENETAASLRLRLLRSRSSSWNETPTQKELVSVLQDLKTIEQEVNDAALRASYALTQSYALYVLGKRQEALRRAEELGTADAVMLVEIWKHAEKKTQKTGGYPRR